MKSKSNQIKSLKQSIKATSSKNMRDSLKLKVDKLEKTEKKKVKKMPAKKVVKKITKKENKSIPIRIKDWDKMKILYNDTKDVKLNIYGFPVSVKSDSFIIRFVEFKKEKCIGCEHEKFVIMQTIYQSGSIDETPFNCVDYLGCTPKEFIKKFEKDNYEKIKEEKNNRLKELKEKGFNAVRFLPKY